MQVLEKEAHRQTDSHIFYEFTLENSHIVLTHKMPD